MAGELKTAIVAALAACFGSMTVLVGQYLTSESTYNAKILETDNQRRQQDFDMVKLALSILGGEISDKTDNSRAFALQLLQKYSGIQLGDAEIQKWRVSGTVDIGQILSQGGPDDDLKRALDVISGASAAGNKGTK